MLLYVNLTADLQILLITPLTILSLYAGRAYYIYIFVLFLAAHFIMPLNKLFLGLKTIWFNTLQVALYFIPIPAQVFTLVLIMTAQNPHFMTDYLNPKATGSYTELEYAAKVNSYNSG